MDPAPVFTFGQLNPRDFATCVCTPHHLTSFGYPPHLPPYAFLFRSVLRSLSLLFVLLSRLFSAVHHVTITPFLRSLLSEEDVLLALRACGCLLFVYFAFVFVFCRFYLFASSVVSSWRRCSLLDFFLSVLFPFCLLSLLFFSDRLPGLVWFGYVPFVTTAGARSELVDVR